MSKEDGLPKGWATARLDEVALVNPPKLVPGAQPDEPFNFVPMSAVTEEFGGIDISTFRPFSEVQKGYTQLQSGDVISAKITPCMENGKIAVVPELDNVCAYGSTEFHVLRPRTGISSSWIGYYLLQSGVRRDARRSMTGSAGQLRVPKPWIEGLVIPIAPTPEQRRIVAKIEELFSYLDAGVAALERAKANLKRYRAAVLKAAVEGKLTEQWRAENPPQEPAAKLLQRILHERRKKWEEDQLAAYEAKGKKPPKNWRDKYKEPAAPDPTNLAPLPKGWCWATVEECSALSANALTDGPFGSNLKTEHYTIEGPRVIRLQNIGDGVYRDDDAHISEGHFANLAKHHVTAGDVVVAMLGETLPRACVVPPHVPPAVVKADCARFAVCDSIMLSSYAVLALNAVTTQMRLSSLIAGVGRPRLNLSKVRGIALPLPPIEEQVRIVSEVDRQLSIVDGLVTGRDSETGRAARLRQSILKRAFEGKLVPQDPHDEPASVLLERIRAARDSRKK